LEIFQNSIDANKSQYEKLQARALRGVEDVREVVRGREEP
jgi:hypothetical protein